MKNKKAFALLIGITLAVPYPVTAAYANVNASEEPQASSESVEPFNTELPHLYALSSDNAPSGLPIIHPERELPSNYDFRKLGLVSPVKNQGTYGTCWAHALLGGLETNLIREYPAIDLSERYLATLLVSKEYGTGSVSFESGEDAESAFGLLTNQLGAVSEEIAPYDDEYTLGNSRDELKEQTEFLVTDVRAFRFIDDDTFDIESEYFKTNLRAVKEAVCDNHAVYMPLDFNNNEMVNHFSNALYNSREQCNTRNSPHAVMIVGYDDNYSADNFLYRPPYDGAWLIKNSWGLENGDYGYYWVSYYDDSIYNMYAFDAVSADTYDNLYSHDEFGTCGVFSASEFGDTDVFISNEYTADENGYITDVMLNCAVPNDNYRITIFTNLSDPSNPVSGEPHESSSGVMEHNGYQTIKLDHPVHINKGEKFAVVAEISGENGYHIACEHSGDTMRRKVGYSEHSGNSINSNSNISEERILQTFGAEQSFFSTDGKNWTDLYDSYTNIECEYNFTGNLCLRALSSDEGKVVFSSYSDVLAPGTDITLSSADDNDIFYSVDGGEYIKYTAPIKFTGEMTLSAYVSGYEDNVYTHHYAEKCASASSILIINSNEAKYADLSGETEIILSVSENETVLRPVTTGTLCYGDKTVGSYEDLSIPCEFKPFSFTVTAEEEGLKSTEYKFNVRHRFEEYFTEGIWFSDTRKGYYCFTAESNSAYYVDLISGKKENFTYSIADNIITIKTADSVRKGYIASDPIFAKIIWDDNTEEYMSFYTYDTSTKMYTVNEICDITNDYVTSLTGKAPKKVTAELNDAHHFIITAIDDSDNKHIFKVDEFTTVGTDEDGNVVNLKKMPVDTGITSFKPGLWALSVSDKYGDIFYYYYFDKNGKDGKIYSFINGSITNFTYTINDGQFKIDQGYGERYSAAAEIYEDSASVTWSMGGENKLVYIMDIDPDNFSFICDDDLKILASKYYESDKCMLTKFDGIQNTDARTVMIYPITENNEGNNSVYYRVDRFTGEAVDQDGRKVDLYNPVEKQGTRFRRGIWKCVDPLNKNMIGYYWFGNPDETSIFTDVFNGNKYDVTYRIRDSRGIISDMDGKRMIDCRETEDGYELSWIDESGNTISREIVFLKEAEKDELKFYNILELAAMAVNDYEMKHDTSGQVQISASGIDEDGNVTLHLVTAKPYRECGKYTIDCNTGKGNGTDGEQVYLPQTGKNSPSNLLTLISAFIMTISGMFFVRKSGILKTGKAEE